jgi:hypothetical protein
VLYGIVRKKVLRMNDKNEEKDVKAIWLEHVEKSQKHGTMKSYRRGLDLFEEYLGETPNAMLEQRKRDLASKDPMDARRFVDLIKEYYNWLQKPIHKIAGKENQKYGMNTARTLSIGVVQFFSFWCVPVKVGFPTVVTGTTAIPTIEEWRQIWNIGDLRAKTAISLGLDVGWRIGDFKVIRVEDLGDLTQECPIQIERLTEKEHEFSSTFISCETLELLKVYIPTLRTDNPFLFQTRSNGSHVDDETFNGMLQELAHKAGLTDEDGVFLNGRNKGKKLSWHSFRKTCLTTSTNLEIDPDTKYILVGKAIEKGQSVQTYLGDIHLKNAFLRVRNALALNKTQQVEKQIDEINELKATVVRLSQEALSKDNQIKTLTEEIDRIKFGQKVQEKKMLDISEDLAEIKTKLGIKEKIRSMD